jgi:predicted lactoylglutathione lyase
MINSDMQVYKQFVDDLIEGKTKEELIKLGYEINLQCDDGQCAYIIENENISLIGILNKNNKFTVDYDSVIIINGSEIIINK